MAAIVCHGGFQSYIESQLVESRIHRFMLPSPKPLPPPQLQQQQQKTIDLPIKSCFWESNTKPHYDENSNKANTRVLNEGWSTIQDLSSANSHKESLYVHPDQVKQSLVRLSPKSLELCTENLGNETGSDMIESDIEFLSSSSSSECGESEPNSEMREEKRKTREARNFPPPLTTIRGSESIRVKPHREGGRLVLQVTKVKVPCCFQAQRSHGRLRLCFWTDEMQQNDDHDTIEEESQSESNFQSQTQEVEDEVDEKEEAEAEEEENEGVVDVDVDKERECELENEYIKGFNDNWSVEGIVKVENNYERHHSHSHTTRRRCKEDDYENKELLLIMNWGEPLWVATS